MTLIAQTTLNGSPGESAESEDHEPMAAFLASEIRRHSPPDFAPAAWKHANELIALAQKHGIAHLDTLEGARIEVWQS